MNSVHLHLMTAHVPVIGVPFVAVLLIAGVVGKSETLWKAGCWALVVVAALTIFPYFSGPPAYELVAERYGVAEAPVERHAVVARGAALGLALLALVTLALLLHGRSEEPPGRVTRFAILVGALAITYGLAWTAHLGGLVRHPELAEPPLRIFHLFGANDDVSPRPEDRD